ncbi:MAG: hypothetical protein G01um101429_62 [Parcubacteria group bacterium Gr01-1014_29]|nr:MAG: hypothetical protein G01um101429_62 [Parcubacteria group bacterium Gr01-1014_29]
MSTPFVDIYKNISVCYIKNKSDKREVNHEALYRIGRARNNCEQY